MRVELLVFLLLKNDGMVSVFQWVLRFISSPPIRKKAEADAVAQKRGGAAAVLSSDN